MLPARGDDIDPGGVDAAVAQNIRQPGDVMVDGVELPGEQVAQVVGEHFLRVHPGALAEVLHHPPDIGTVQGPPVS